MQVPGRCMALFVAENRVRGKTCVGVCGRGGGEGAHLMDESRDKQ